MRNREIRGIVVRFLLLGAAAPALWLGYNAIVYRNPLEFANGPYSARAIEQKTAVPGSPAHPGAGDLRVAASYFLKAAELNMAASNWHRFWLALLFLGAAGLSGYKTQALAAATAGSAVAVLHALHCLQWSAHFHVRPGGRSRFITLAMGWNCCQPLLFLARWRPIWPQVCGGNRWQDGVCRCSARFRWLELCIGLAGTANCLP